MGGLAFAARLTLVLLGGGLTGMGNYDDGVYFGAADALVHGRWPYRDFLFLQPPGIVLVLAPFATLGRLVGDAHAFALARLAFLALGGLNAALVVLVLRRFGAAAALVGGVFYALTLPAVSDERSTLLEPVGSMAVLLALLVAAPGGAPDPVRDARPTWLLVLAGAGLGLATTVKIWYVLPAVVVLVVARRRMRPLLAGAVVTGLAASGLALGAPAAAWREVVLDQLGRPRIAGSVVGRLTSIVQPPRLPHVSGELMLLVAGAVVVALVALTATTPGARVFVVLLLSSVGLLLLTPSYYRHYAALAVPPLALVVGVGVSRVLRLETLPRRRAGATVAVLLVLSVGCLAGWRGAGVRLFVRPPLPHALVRAVRDTPGCVTTDDPSVLILSGTLSRTLSQGCPFWPDVTGWLYDADASPPGRTDAPTANQAWQRHAYAYLTSGDATVLVRRHDGLSSRTREHIGVTATYGPRGFVFTTLPR